MVEVEKSYASKGIAGTALGFGIGGAALGLLNGGMGLLGGRAATCSENMPVTRYDQEQQAKIAKLEADVALRDANTYGDQKLLEMYKYIQEVEPFRSCLRTYHSIHIRVRQAFLKFFAKYQLHSQRTPRTVRRA